MAKFVKIKLLIVCAGDAASDASSNVPTSDAPDSEAAVSAAPESEAAATEHLNDSGNRKENKERCRQLISRLEERGEECMIVADAAIIKTLLSELGGKGYVVRRSRIGRVVPEEKIRATHRSMHCGICQHNCHLSNPGCNVGKERAIRELP